MGVFVDTFTSIKITSKTVKKRKVIRDFSVVEWTTMNVYYWYILTNHMYYNTSWSVWFEAWTSLNDSHPACVMFLATPHLLAVCWNKASSLSIVNYWFRESKDFTKYTCLLPTTTLFFGKQKHALKERLKLTETCGLRRLSLMNLKAISDKIQTACNQDIRFWCPTPAFVLVLAAVCHSSK